MADYIATGITATFATLGGELINVRHSGEKTDFVDVTNQGNAAALYKVFKAAMTDGGEITLTMAFDPDAVIPAVQTSDYVKITFPSGATNKFRAPAIYGGRGFSADLGQKIVSDLTFKISGVPNWQYT